MITNTDEVGAEKTALLCKMLRLESDHQFYLDLQYPSQFLELLRLILRDLGLASQQEPKLSMIEELKRYLIQQLKQRHIVFVQIDEVGKSK